MLAPNLGLTILNPNPDPIYGTAGHAPIESVDWRKWGMTDYNGAMPKKRLQRARHQGRLLDVIMTWKRQELAREMAEMPESDLQALLTFAPRPLDVMNALARPGVSLLAQVIRATPAKGLLAREFDPVDMALAYARGGADAILCTTDARFYQGDLAHLTAIKEAFRAQGIGLPVIRFDIHFHPYQVLRARVAGADGVWLMMASLSETLYRQLLTYAWELGMEALVAVHTPQELEQTLRFPPRVLVLDQQDPHTGQWVPDHAAKLRPQVPEGIRVVVRGDVRGREDRRRLAALGVDGVVVDEVLARARQKERQKLVQRLTFEDVITDD